jgi:transposase
MYAIGSTQPNRAQRIHSAFERGQARGTQLKRAQILLAADAGASDAEIARSVGVGGSTVYRTKRRFVLGNMEAALSEGPRPGAKRKLTGKEEALLVATTCSSPPAGRARWTLELLADAIVKLTPHESLSRETVRRRLAENDLKSWKDMWCIPQIDADYVARMEDVLDLYAEAPDGLLRRKPDPADRRSAPADPGHAGTDRALRLRVSTQWHRKPVRLPRPASLPGAR